MSSDPPPPSPHPLTTPGYEDAISYLFSLEKIGIKFGLENIRFLLENLGNPQENYPSIHISGTNGKGSTAQFITAILIAAGYRVGTYTSPHLIDFAERIQINASPISKDIITEGLFRIRRYIGSDKYREREFVPTYFEVSTALAFWCFAREEVDVAVVETGMGGRLDATNVLDPTVSVITNIALEHQEYLGNTLTEIAYEKAGIIKPGRPLVLGETDPDLVPLFEKRCQELQAEFYPAVGDVEVLEENNNGSRFHIRGNDIVYDDLQIGLLGRFQVDNACLAVRVCGQLNSTGWEISEESLRTGLKSAAWPGRMHVLQKKPWVVADGAHNPQAAASLMENIRCFFNFRRLLLIFGCMRDKDILETIGKFLPAAERIILTRSKSDRAEDPQNILNMIDREACRAKSVVIQDAQSAVEMALDEAGADDMVLITGSLYVVGDILPMFG